MWIVLSLVASFLQPPEPVWVWPVQATPQVVRDFDAPATEWGPGHRGLDLAARPGIEVVAPISGSVSFSGRVVDRVVITITTSDGDRVTLEPVELDEEPPTRVRAGQSLGRVAGGHCPQGCLHIGLREDDHYRSPARELGIERRAVLVE